MNITLPHWLETLLEKPIKNLIFLEDKMNFAITLSAQNVAKKTGGPFGAAIFETNSNQLISVGVNQVVPQNNCVLHAEVMALMLAQFQLKTYCLENTPDKKYIIVSSCEPCAMCLGAIYWSQIGSIAYGATDQDATEIGFDEGVKPQDWAQKYTQKGRVIIPEVLREKAITVFKNYQKEQGIIY